VLNLGLEFGAHFNLAATIDLVVFENTWTLIDQLNKV
jgi:hypothetical protein